MLRKLHILFFCMLISAISNGQDIHFSQFIYIPMNLNPANTGLFNGDMRFNAVYRQQWNSITVPYRTFSLAYDQVIGKPNEGSHNAAGIVINNDRAGDGDYGTFQALLSFAHLFALGSDSVHFLNEEAPLPPRMQLHSSALLNKNSKLSWLPSVLYMDQEEFRELTFGIEAIFSASKSSIRKNAFSISCHYRTDDALIPAIGVYYNQWRFGVSYDINTSNLDAASNGRGGPEFNVIYILKKIRYTSAKNICPVY